MEIIPKFQQGGGFESLFTEYHPILPSSRRTTRSSKKSDDGYSESSTKSSKKSDDEEKGELTKALFFTMLKDLMKALPNDSKSITDNLIKLFKLSDLGIDVGSLETRYLATLLKIEQASSRKGDFDLAYDQAVEKGYISDYAIDELGRIQVLDENNKLVKLTPEEWQKEQDSGKYLPLTYANVLWLSQNMPEYVGDYLFIHAAQSGISTEKVSELIKNNLINLGSSETRRELMATKKGLDIVKGAEMLLSGNPDGVYNIKETSKESNQLMLAALNYIYTMLPKNAKNKLRYMTTNPDTVQGSIDIIKNLIISGANTLNTVSVTYDKTASQAAGFVDANGDKLKLGQWSQIQKGEGGIDAPITIMEGETKYAMGVTGKYYSAFPGVESGPTTLANFLAKTGLQHMAQGITGITFGTAKIAPSDYSHIMYDNSGGYVATLPATTKDGVKVVNVEILKEYSDIIKSLNSKGITEESENFNQELGLALKDAGYSELLDANGLPNPKYFGKFLVVQGYSTEKVESINLYYNNAKETGNIVTVKKIDPDDDPQVAQQIITTLKYKDLDKDYWLTGDYSLYKAAVYIPLSNNPNDAANADKVQLTATLSHGYEADYLNLNKKLNMQSTETPPDLQ